ncbi:hypothetical protein PG999_007574 [Apiospora kogelbergensis]|uniref:Uncharacterized protein n=1 Tax=Apiospora kogelbergensis TaxID=1337665 RepID=A0AAW0QLL7_9PEZI
MKAHIFAGALTLWVPIILAAWDPSKRDCSEQYLCLTSFKWCDPQGTKHPCFYPEGTYPAQARPGGSIQGLVMENFNHTISWKVQPNNRDKPVTVNWWLGKDLKWEVNTTDSQIIFNPARIIRELIPELGRATIGDSGSGGGDGGNVSHAKAIRYVYASMSNVISLRQPSAGNRKPSEDPTGNLNTARASTDQFVVGSSWVEKFLDAQYQRGHIDERKTWGIGAGVGLGVPVLMAAAWIAVRWWRGYRKHAAASAPSKA